MTTEIASLKNLWSQWKYFSYKSVSLVYFSVKQDNNGYISPSELAHMMVALGHNLSTEEVQVTT